MLYSCVISSLKCDYFILMNSQPDIDDARKKSLISRYMNLAPFIQSEMTLLMTSFVSSKDAAGDETLSLHDNLSPPTTRWHLCGSVFKGQWSNTKFA